MGDPELRSTPWVSCHLLVLPPVLGKTFNRNHLLKIGTSPSFPTLKQWGKMKRMAKSRLLNQKVSCGTSINPHPLGDGKPSGIKSCVAMSFFGFVTVP